MWKQKNHVDIKDQHILYILDVSLHNGASQANVIHTETNSIHKLYTKAQLGSVSLFRATVSVWLEHTTYQ